MQKTVKYFIHFQLITLIVGSCDDGISNLDTINLFKTSHNYEWTIDTLKAPEADDVTQILMNDIWGSNENNVWTVGHSDDVDYQIWHWDGMRWININPLIYGDSPSYSEITGFSENDIWLAGDDAYKIPTDPDLKFRGYILHFDGTAWRKIEEIKAPSCYTVWGMSSDNIYFGCDSGLIIKHTDDNWQVQSTGTLAQITSIWGFKSNRIFATGYSWESKCYYFFEKITDNWEIKDSINTDPFNGHWKFGNLLWGLDIDQFYSVGSGGLFIYKDNKWEKLLSSNSLSCIYGTKNNIFTGGFQNRLYHYNGAEWYQYKEFLDGDKWFDGVWCNSTSVFIIMRELSKTYILKGKQTQ